MTKTVKEQTIKQKLDVIADKMELINKIYPVENKDGTPSITVDEAKKKISLWSAQTFKQYGSKKKGKYKYKSPLVMDMNGQFTPADKVIEASQKPEWKATTKNYAADSSFNPGGGLGPLNNLNLYGMDALLIDNWFLGAAQYSILVQNSLLYKICDTMAEELVRKGWEFKGTDEDVSEDKLLELTAELDRLDVKSTIHWAAFLTYTQGDCLVFPKLKGDEEPGERETPLSIDETGIQVGDLQAIRTIEKTWYVAIKYNATDPFDPWFYVPEFYTVMGQITHSTRVWKMMQNQVPNLLKPVYQFGGIPMLGQLIKWVSNFEKMYDSVLTIVDKLNMGILKTDQAAIIADDPALLETSASNLVNRVQLATDIRDNTSILVLAQNEEFEQVSMTLAGLDVLLTKSLEYLAIIPGAPIIKLFGSSPSGMNATGDFELNSFYDKINSTQEKMVRPILTNIMHCAMLNIWGKIDDKITFEFVKLKETDPVQDAQIGLTRAQTDDIYIQNQTLGQPDVQRRLAADPSSGYNEIEVDEEDMDNEIMAMMPKDPEEDEK